MRASVRGRARASRSASRCNGSPPEGPAPEPFAPERVAARIEDTRRGVALLGGRARHLRGPAPRARAAQLARAEGPHLPADRRDRRRADDLAARDGRRRAQLGLPLLLDPRREPDDRSAVHRRVLGRGGGVRLVHDELGRRPRERALAADHVRDQRRARPLRARAAAPARLARLRAGPGRQRRLGPDAARRLRRAAQLARICTASSSASSIRRSSGSSPISRTPRRGAGARPTPACGRCAASRATTSHPRSCAGSRSTARSSSPTSSAMHADVEHWASERDMIREAMLTRGWSEARQAYAQSFDSDELDAAQLLMPILGFLPATDERMRSTIDAIADELTEDGLVLRYRNEEGLNADGLTGEEGTFVICSLLARLRAREGRRGRSRRGAVRQARRLRQRPRAAGRGDRHRQRRAAGQLPAGVQPHRADHRRLGDRQGARARRHERDAARPGLRGSRPGVRGRRRRGTRSCRSVVEVDAHEGPVYFADENALYFTTLPGAGADGSPLGRRSSASSSRQPERGLSRRRRCQRGQRHGAGPDGGLLVCEQGTPLRARAHQPPGPRQRASARRSSTGGGACVSTRPTTSSPQATGRSGSRTRATATSRASGQSRRSATSSIATTRAPVRRRVVADSFDKPNGLALLPG